MLFPTLTSAAVFANATSAAQAERAESGGPEAGSLSLQPTLDIRGEFEFVGHQHYMAHAIYACQEKQPLPTKINYRHTACNS